MIFAESAVAIIVKAAAAAAAAAETCCLPFDRGLSSAPHVAFDDLVSSVFHLPDCFLLEIESGKNGSTDNFGEIEPF